jgi:hypothetical protein
VSQKRNTHTRTHMPTTPMTMEKALAVLNTELDACSIAREARYCIQDFNPLERIPKKKGDWCLRPVYPWSSRFALYILSHNEDNEGILIKMEHPSESMIKIVYRDTMNRVYFDRNSGYFELTGSVLAGERIRLLKQRLYSKSLQLMSQYDSISSNNTQ